MDFSGGLNRRKKALKYCKIVTNSGGCKPTQTLTELTLMT
jgi:hypothetical protein